MRTSRELTKKKPVKTYKRAKYEHSIRLKRERIRNALEEIVVNGNKRSPVMNLIDVYFSFSEVYPIWDVPDELEIEPAHDWPKDLKNFMLSLNRVFWNPEIYDEGIKASRIYNMIKNKYLSLCGFRFPRRA